VSDSYTPLKPNPNVPLEPKGRPKERLPSTACPLPAETAEPPIIGTLPFGSRSIICGPEGAGGVRSPAQQVVMPKKATTLRTGEMTKWRRGDKNNCFIKPLSKSNPLCRAPLCARPTPRFLHTVFTQAITERLQRGHKRITTAKRLILRANLAVSPSIWPEYLAQPNYGPLVGQCGKGNVPFS
jgi:hypothetical protein